MQVEEKARSETKVNSINEETKRKGWKLQMVMVRPRQKNRKRTRRGQIDHLFRVISRAALINGTSVRNGSAIEKNGCRKSCDVSSRFSTFTSSVFAR